MRDSSTKEVTFVEKKRQRQWDKKHLRTVSTKITVQDFQILSEYCRKFHTTPYRLMKEFILAMRP